MLTPVSGVCSTLNECVMRKNLWAYISFKYRVVRNLPEAEFWRKKYLLSDRLTVPLSVTYIHTYLERYLVLTFEYYQEIPGGISHRILPVIAFNTDGKYGGT